MNSTKQDSANDGYFNFRIIGLLENKKHLQDHKKEVRNIYVAWSFTAPLVHSINAKRSTNSLESAHFMCLPWHR
ncbi:hypothetical protein L596_002356 [Steinernema carpocapsae]|uniref:Uncharacterized protein n=1 Tax=Steinernema carpocapsae TaxID=34508 RepID=A0A4U8URR0_STECR|nr:hypothetical protein L596_002356 [Steinernema carpocapsae]